MNNIESIDLIYRNPNVRGGRPCIVGTTLRVLDIVNAMNIGRRSPEQMAESYQVSLAKIHAALAYYYENQDEIDADIREDQRRSEEIAARVLANKRSLYSRLQRYMRDDEFRAALSEAMETSDDNRAARIRALFAKMDAAGQDLNAVPAAQMESSLE